MAANDPPYEPRQRLLLPEAIQDWLPDGHLAHFINDTVDRLELKAFRARYATGGPRNQTIIVAAEATNCASDAGELPGMLRAVTENLGVMPKQVLADTGYRGEAVFEQLAGCGCDLVVALGREGKPSQRFDPQRSPQTAAIVAKLQTEAGRSAYRRRKWIAEPPNGWIKNVHGFRQFSLRGLDRVKAEWKLVCLALNLRRMASMHPASC